MKKLLLLSVLVVFGLTVTAQQKGKIRVGLNYGYVFANEGEGGGILANLEVKYNLGDLSNIGFQAGFAGAKSNLHTEVDVNWNVLGTYDYYFNKNNSLAATPFLGAG